MWGILHELTTTTNHFIYTTTLPSNTDPIPSEIISDLEFNKLINEDSSETQTDNSYLNIWNFTKQKILNFVISKRIKKTNKFLKQMEMERECFFLILRKLKDEYKKINIYAKVKNFEKRVSLKEEKKQKEEEEEKVILKNYTPQFKKQNKKKYFKNKNSAVFFVVYVYVFCLLSYLLLRTCWNIGRSSPLRIYVLITFYIAISIYLF